MDLARMALAQLWQVTALIVFVVIVTRLIARNRPHLAYVLWLVVLLKCITPPLWSSPSGAFSWLQASLSHEASNLCTATPAIEPSRVAIDFNLAASELDNSDAVALPPQAYEAPLQAVDVSQQRTPEDNRGARSMLLFVAIWGTGVALALVATGYQWLQCIWKLWRTPAIHVPDLESLVSELSRRLKVRRRVRVLVTSSRVGPAVIGLVRPLIVLPEVVVRGKRVADLEAILAHELIHVRRGDLWLGVLQVASKAVWWFYPLVWWVSGLSTREAERCCDEEVIGELGCDPKRYARSLLEVLELKRTLQPVPAFPGMKPVEVTTQRLERIMKLGQGCHKRTPRRYWVVMLLLAAAALPGAAFIAADEGPAPGVSDLPNLQLAEGQPDGAQVLGRVESPEPLSVASYVAKDVLAAIQADYDCDEREALQTFGTQLICAARLSDKPLKVQDRVRIWQGTITVAATDEEHERLTAAVERMQKYGVAQINIDLRFVTVPERIMTQKIKDWELIPADLGDEAAGLPQSHLHDVIDRPWPADDSRPFAKSGVTTTTNLPALYKIIDNDTAQQLLEDLQGDNRSNSLQCPKVTLFNCQSVRIADSVQRPFIVGLRSVGNAEQAAEPHIRIIECGTMVRLRPLLRRNGKLWLDYDMKVVRIEDVRETRVRAAGASEPVTLQVPKVHEARIESAVEFDLDKTVIIGGLPAESIKDKPQQLLVLLTAKRVTPTGGNRLELAESPAGQLMFGAGVNSDVGLRGELTIDGEQHVTDIQRKLANPVSVDFKQVPLAQALQSLGAQAGFNIEFDAQEIAVEGLTPDSPVTLSVKNCQVQRALYLMLEALNLRYEVSGEQLVIHAKETEPVYPSVYNVADLVTVDLDSIKPKGFKDGVYASPLARTFDILIAAITEQVAPGSWEVAGGPGVMEAFTTNLSLVVSQTNGTHQELARFLRDVRKKLGLSVAQDPMDEESPPRTAPPTGRSTQVTARVYHVADLVVPVPPVRTNKEERLSAALADFDTLIDVIKSTLAPDTWAEAGGAGTIEPMPTNLSLVISNRGDVHDEVSQLLGQLRRLQDVQVTLETQFIRGPKHFLNQLELDFATADGTKHELDFAGLDDDGYVILSGSETVGVLRAVKASRQAALRAAPKITFFNGQSGSLSFAAEPGQPEGIFHFQPVCADHHRSVRLSLAIGSEANLKQAKVHTIAAGDALLLKVTGDVTSEMLGWPRQVQGVPILSKVPYASRLFKRDTTPAEDMLVLITPHIIVQGEEEQQINLGGVKPHIIIQEEKHEQLGIDTSR